MVVTGSIIWDTTPVRDDAGIATASDVTYGQSEIGIS